jgi:hypothetical protein
MENKEIINENELLELANRYIQLEKEFEEYKNKINSEWLIPFGHGLLIDTGMYDEIDFELKECGFNLTWDIFMDRFHDFSVFNPITESDVFLENLIIKVKQSVKYITYKTK